MLIPLRNYSNYSICESNIKVEDLVEFASKNKLPAIALTDYKLLSGALEFSIKCQKKGGKTTPTNADGESNKFCHPPLRVNGRREHLNTITM